MTQSVPSAGTGSDATSFSLAGATNPSIGSGNIFDVIAEAQSTIQGNPSWISAGPSHALAIDGMTVTPQAALSGGYYAELPSGKIQQTSVIPVPGVAGDLTVTDFLIPNSALPSGMNPSEFGQAHYAYRNGEGRIAMPIDANGSFQSLVPPDGYDMPSQSSLQINALASSVWQGIQNSPQTLEQAVAVASDLVAFTNGSIFAHGAQSNLGQSIQSGTFSLDNFLGSLVDSQFGAMFDLASGTNAGITRAGLSFGTSAPLTMLGTAVPLLGADGRMAFEADAAAIDAGRAAEVGSTGTAGGFRVGAGGEAPSTWGLEPGSPAFPRATDRTVLDQMSSPVFPYQACAPTGGCMVLADAGLPYDISTLARQAGTNIEGTEIYDLTSALQNNGLPQTQFRVGTTLDDLRSATSNGGPVLSMMDLSMTDHIVVVDGFAQIPELSAEELVALRDPWHGRSYYTPVSEFSDRFSGVAISPRGWAPPSD